MALESQGYRVLPASSGAEGIELFLAHEGEIKLLVSDLVMPGMSGGQLAQELRKLRSNLEGPLYQWLHRGAVHSARCHDHDGRVLGQTLQAFDAGAEGTNHP